MTGDKSGGLKRTRVHHEIKHRAEEKEIDSARNLTPGARTNTAHGQTQTSNREGLAVVLHAPKQRHEPAACLEHLLMYKAQLPLV